MKRGRIGEPAEIDYQPVGARRPLPRRKIGLSRQIDHAGEELQCLLVGTGRRVRGTEGARRHQVQLGASAGRSHVVCSERGRIGVVVASHLRTGEHRGRKSRDLPGRIAVSRVQLGRFERMSVRRRAFAQPDLQPGETAEELRLQRPVVRRARLIDALDQHRARRTAAAFENGCSHLLQLIGLCGGHGRGRHVGAHGENAAAPPQRNVHPDPDAVEKSHKCTGYRPLGTWCCRQPEFGPPVCHSGALKRLPAASNKLETVADRPVRDTRREVSSPRSRRRA